MPAQLESSKVTRRRAPVWVCVMMNQLAFPGLGTIMAGRRGGFFQATIMVAGFLLVMGYMLLYLTAVVRYMQDNGWNETEFHAQYRPYVWALFWGIGLCLVAWLWALASSIALWRASRVER